MVALVVTIIILLILAGIVLGLTIVNNGILGRAKNAVEKHQEASVNEQIELNNLYTLLASNDSNIEGTDIEKLGVLIEKTVDKKLEEERLKQYPVGSIYMSQEEKNPAEFIGGEWEQIKDTFLLSAGDKYEAGTTGGEESHTLTIAEMPSHSHAFSNGGVALVIGSKDTIVAYRNGFSNVSNSGWWVGHNKNVSDIANTGSSQGHNNMPPYLTVYMYKRIK